MRCMITVQVSVHNYNEIYDYSTKTQITQADYNVRYMIIVKYQVRAGCGRGGQPQG